MSYEIFFFANRTDKSHWNLADIVETQLWSHNHGGTDAHMVDEDGDCDEIIHKNPSRQQQNPLPVSSTLSARTDHVVLPSTDHVPTPSSTPQQTSH